MIYVPYTTMYHSSGDDIVCLFRTRYVTCMTLIYIISMTECMCISGGTQTCKSINDPHPLFPWSLLKGVYEKKVMYGKK